LRKQLVLQFFSESFLIVFFSFAISLLLAQLVLPFFNEVADKQITILWSLPFFWLMSFAFIIITSLIAGSYPAFYLSSFKPIQVLKGTFKAGRYAALPRKILVVSQFTVSITLIIGTIIVYQQIQFAKNRPVGYSRANLVSIPTMNSSIHDHFDVVKEELMQTGMISSMAESQSALTGIWGSTSGFSWSGKDPNLSIDFGTIFSSHDYGKTIDWKIKEGRDFSREFATDSSAVILNEAAINYMGLKNPVGEVVTWWGQPYTIIGIIDNMVMESPYDELRPVIYFLTNEPGNLSLIKLKSSVSANEAIAKIEPIFKKLNPDHPFEFQFVDDEYAKKFGNEERIGKLAGFFAMLAVLICCLGIFGLASFTAEQRTKEIGIRKVLGASVTKLWQMLSKDFIVLVLLSCLLAIPISYYFLHQWLLKYEYRTDIGWWVFMIAGSGALLITLLTVSYQAVKAALANPVKSLRSE
jgi:ABC-type antimicrobial peptide transport system permease subunit